MVTGKDEAIDYGDDAKDGATATENLLATIDFLANAALDAEAEVDDAEATLKLKKERLKDIVERQLTEAMEAARQKKLTTISNVDVTLVNKVRASLPKEAHRANAALNWLRDKGHGAIIKTVLGIPFESGRDPAALGLQALLLLLAKDQAMLDLVKEAVTLNAKEDLNELIAPAFAFLAAIGNDADNRILLESTVKWQTLSALVRELLSEGRIDQAGMDVIGAYASKEAEVKRKD